MSKPKVYFTKIISPEKVLEMYKLLNVSLKGNVCVKVHSGEQGNKNFLGPELMIPLVNYVKGTIVETNSAYNGPRGTTENHLKLMEEHGWSKNFKVEILDSSGPDIELPIPNGNLIKKNFIGKNTKNYNSCLVISHFKGHAMGGFGGALKQLSIGFGSVVGKTYQHTGGKTMDSTLRRKNFCNDEQFKEAMADAAYSVVELFGKENLAYVNIMKNISKSCDCAKNAEPPLMKDIGILSSIDPVALDKACIDLIYNSDDPGKTEVIERIESKKGLHIFECSEKLGIGNTNYELINID